MTVGISSSMSFEPTAPVCGLRSKNNGPHWNLVILSTGFRGSLWSTWSRSEECFSPPFPVSLRWENHFPDVSLTFSAEKRRDWADNGAVYSPLSLHAFFLRHSLRKRIALRNLLFPKLSSFEHRKWGAGPYYHSLFLVAKVVFQKGK